MKKQLKWIALLIAVIMLMSSIGTCVFAQTETEKKGYVCIGDSITRGVSATRGDSKEAIYNFSRRDVQGSYPYTVATTNDRYHVVSNANSNNDGADNEYYPMATPGQSLEGAMYMLGIEGPSTSPKAYSANGFITEEIRDAMLNYYGNGKGESYIKNADLITIEQGMIDVFMEPLASLEENGAKSGDTASMTTALIKGMNASYDRWETNYPYFVKTLHEWNPDAKILLIGNYNLLYNFSLTEDMALPIGNAVGLITQKMNRVLQEVADQYDNCEYVDIANVNCGGTQTGFSLEKFLNSATPYLYLNSIIHPTQEGYDYIARQILAKLETKQVTTNIVMDTCGEFSQFNYVLVDGKLMPNAKIEGYTLTVPYRHKYAKSMTVGFTYYDQTVKKTKLAIYQYTLKYNDKEGYQCHRVYNTNDAVGTGQKVINNVKTTLMTGTPAFVTTLKTITKDVKLDTNFLATFKKLLNH